MLSNYSLLSLLVLILALACNGNKNKDSGEWIDLFNGKDLTGWKSSENEGSFKVSDGMIIASGPRSHLFYTGDVENASFKNFEMSVDVMTTHLANSGIYFHTQYQEEGWPERGYEVQINNSHIGEGDYRELKKTGSLYGVRNSYKTYVKDSVWFNVHIIVRDKHVLIEVGGKKIVDYEERSNPLEYKLHNRKDSLMTPGTFGLQCHDPESKVFYKNIKLRILPDNSGIPTGSSETINDSYLTMMEIQSNQFPFIDLHVPANEQLNIDSVVDFYYRTGINMGIVFDLTNTNEMTGALQRHAEKFSSYPVFLGVKKSNDINADQFFKRNEKIDYIMGVVKLRDEPVTDKEKFMDEYVAEVVSLLNSGDIDIWAMPTLLPSSLDSEYDNLWTNERVTKVVDAARSNDVAIEVHNQLQIPGIDFVKQAKANGCRFTCGGIGREEAMGRADYFLKVIQQCGLGYKDMYVPGTTARRPPEPAKVLTAR